MPHSSLVQSVCRAIDISEHIAQSETGLTLSELAGAMKLKQPTVHNLVRTLVAKQINGLYKVKHPAMKPLYDEAMAALRRHFDGRWTIRNVPRAQNARADALVNEALDGLR